MCKFLKKKLKIDLPYVPASPLLAIHPENKDHGVWSHQFMANAETVETVADLIFLGSKITTDGDCSQILAPWKKSSDKPRQQIKKQRQL